MCARALAEAVAAEEARGLSEAQAAQQIMVLIGAQLKDAILLATNAERAGQRVRRASVQNRGSLAKAAVDRFKAAAKQRRALQRLDSFPLRQLL